MLNLKKLSVKIAKVLEELNVFIVVTKWNARIAKALVNHNLLALFTKSNYRMTSVFSKSIRSLLEWNSRRLPVGRGMQVKEVGHPRPTDRGRYAVRAAYMLSSSSKNRIFRSFDLQYAARLRRSEKTIGRVTECGLCDKDRV